MRLLVRTFLAKIISKEMKRKLKTFEYKRRKSLVTNLPKISESQLKNIIINKLGIKEGDHLFIHASLDMINTDVSPLDILKMILKVVGEEGSVSVPTFIRYSSKDWMLMDKEFNIKRTPSGMGLFSERVRRYPGASRSLHPTKSVATIGSIAKDILSEHHLDIYQFGSKSPFFKLLKHDVKVIGLGAPMSYLSMVHVIEDINSEEFPLKVNEEKIFQKYVIDENKNSLLAKTLVHNLNVVVKANPEKFVKKYMDKDDFIIFNHYMTPFFNVDGYKLFQELEKQLKLGNTIYN